MSVIDVLAEAKSELVEAVGYLEQQRRGAGDSLLEAYEQAIAFLRQYPKGAPRGGLGTRRKQLLNFPYAIVYSIEGVDGDILLVIALAHHSRRPRYWRDRMPSR